MVACTAHQLQLQATTDKNAYPATGSATLGLTIKNVSTTPCSLDVGSGPVSLVVYSGNDRIWSSDDCQQQATSDIVTLQPGKNGRMASSATWQLTRSTAGCPTGQPKVRAGNYRLDAKVGEFTATAKSFTVQ